MRFDWIKTHRKHWPVNLMCRVLQVSRSGYYAWTRRPPSERAERRATLTQKIRQVHEDSRHNYGSPRVHLELVEQGERVNVKTVAKLMRENHIKSRIKRRFNVKTTDSTHGYAIAPNRLERNFTFDQPNRAWVADITYVPTLEGWLYLAVVLDLHARKVIGYATADHLRTSLPLDALAMAIDTRQPNAKAGDALIHHSDRGVQYACVSYRAMLEAHGLDASMSRRSDCYDNAVAESFFGTLKQELVHHECYATRAEAAASITDYIDNFYNPIRRHSTLGYVSPMDYERMTA